ncbi:patatin-like phospholipase family protein [Micromonospora krabiensis]|uniref:NTE family protein n=1 Tax=Micromonospora krabiensis TaxID=307121 RepID=A0A1C3N7B4_9ACTN|nr:patatin-like phospholipase family protein [Micromonospora krabiensis]SBV28460.1 NTE family protein [Micromonospora krabiensis]
MTNALVLAGGGVAGIAWELGVLRGLADADPALAERVIAADLVVGTSAGSTVAAQVTSGVPLDDLYQVQLDPETTEMEVDVDTEKLFTEYGAVLAGASDPQEARRRLGSLALAARTVDPAVRLAAIDARLRVKRWPDRDVRLPAVDAETGEVVVFTRESGASLVDAVAASCAVPGVWPPVAIDGRRYVDGGVRSMTNADLAAGAERVLVIQPSLEGAPQPWGDLDDEIAALAPAAVVVISADQASVDAFGTNALSPATRGPSARAGRAVGAAHAEAVAALWT